MNYTKSEVLKQIRQMDPNDFERLVAEIYENYDWDVSVTPFSKDRGVDIIATQSYPVEQKALIQAKRYSKENRVGGPEVRKYASLRQQEDGDIVVLVTSSEFTKQAEEIAGKLNVELVDSEKLYEIIMNLGNSEILEKYADTDSSQIKYEKTTSNKDKLEKIMSNMPRERFGNDYSHVKKILLETIDPDQTWNSEGHFHEPAINRINDTEIINLYWLNRHGVGLIKKGNRSDAPGGKFKSLNLITSENIIIIVGEREQDRVLKIPRSNIKEVSRPSEVDNYGRYNNDMKINLLEKQNVDWFKYSFDTVYIDLDKKHQFVNRVIDRLRNNVFICEECGSEFEEYNKAEGTDVCERCFSKSSL